MILRLPTNRSIGTFLAGPSESNGDWVEFADAAGLVELPDGKEIQLRIDSNAIFDSSILLAIPPNALSVFEWVSTSQVTNAAIGHIGHLKGLKGLALWETPIGDEGIAHLQGLENLASLDIGDTRTTDEGLSYLSRLSSLRELTLLGTQVSAEGLRYLRVLEQLERLDLMNTPIDDEAVPELSLISRLKSVRIYKTRMTMAGYLALKQALPECAIRFHHPHVPDLLNKW